MATTAANIDSTEAPSLTTDSEFDEQAQPPAERNEQLQPQIVSTVARDQDNTSEIVSPDEVSGAKNVSHLESSRVALLASDFASWL